MCTLKKSCIELSFLTYYMTLIPRAGSPSSPDPPSSSIPVAVVVSIVLILLVLGIVVFLVFLFCCRAGLFVHICQC